MYFIGMKIMNKQEIIEKLGKYKSKFQEQYGILSIGIFGSVARGQNTDTSDIDIFVETEVPNPFILVQVKEDLEELFKTKIDIVRKRNNMNPILKSRIESEGVYV